MRKERKTDRQIEIEAVAYELLIERGFAATSMLEIAKRARASNETLYRWYDDKMGLFASMVKRNAAGGIEQLKQPLEDTKSDKDKLRSFGTALLKGILSDKAIALNKVAASAPSGELGAILSKHGRESVVEMLLVFFEELPLSPKISSKEDLVDVYLSLLLGDLQARRILGRFDEPDAAFCAIRSARAVNLLFDILRQSHN